MTAVFGSWNLSAVASATAFHGLAPIGVGSAEVESLTSYLRRLAASHGLTPGVFIMRALAPRLVAGGAEPLVSDEHPQLRGLLIRGATAINGNTGRSAAWAAVLEEATGQQHLTRLTLAGLRDVLPRRALIRPTRAYCQPCLRSARASGQPPHDRLLWALASVEACPRHRVRLTTRCARASCGAPLPHLTWLGQPAHCPTCGVWLGVEEAEPELATDYDIWASGQAGRLLVALGEGRSFTGVARDAIVRFIRDRELRQKDLAWRIGMRSGNLSGWTSGVSQPSLPWIFRLAHVMGADPVELIDGRLQLTSGQVGTLAPHPGRVPIDWPGVRRKLVKALTDEPPRSLRQVVTGIGPERTSVRMREPKLCRTISKRYEVWRSEQGATREARLQELVGETVRQLISQGHCASRREVEADLPSAVSVREPALYMAWRTAREPHAAHHGCSASGRRPDSLASSRQERGA